LIKEEEFREKAIDDVAEKMCLAARTAPKARGVDFISIAKVKGETIDALSDKMQEIGERSGAQFFKRDAENIKLSKVVVLLGSKVQATGVRACDFCGFDGCAERDKNLPAICAFNAGDLGIAIGSALSVAMDHRIDNRIMYSVGKAAVELKLLGDEVKMAYGIPLTATSKNPFFDRK
jgi:uncharacterized ferredoxin-like protein